MRSIALIVFAATLILLPTVSCSKSTPTPKTAQEKGSPADQTTVDAVLAPETNQPQESERSLKIKNGDSNSENLPTSLEDRQNEDQLSSQDREKLAAKELEKINSEYATAGSELNAAIEKLATDEEKQALFEQRNPEPRYTRQLFEMAKRFPETDSAFTAGMTIILEYPNRPEFPSTMNLILEHHGQRVEWHRIAGGYLELVPSRQVEDWMRKMIDKAANDEVKVQMTYLMYRYFDQFPTFAATIEYNPQIKKRFTQEKIDYIYKRNRQVRDELLEWLRDLKQLYPTVKAEGNRLVKDVIDGPIFELENLQVGSIAPEIEGVDFDGVEFRLSDYRGKVVMLDFWGQWCPPCRAMFPHERELIEDLAGKPFVLIGVNSDRKLETAIKATRDQNLVWRNFWCGPQGRAGPIAKKWNVSAWPTVYLIDADGVIRYKEVLGRDIDLGIQTLLGEMGHPISLVDQKRNNASRLAGPQAVDRFQELLVQQDQ